MTFNLFFDVLIYFSSIFLIIFAVMVFKRTLKLHRMGKEKISLLEANFNKEKNKSLIIDGHVSLANGIEKTLVYRLFEISKELIELQRLLLNSV